MNHCGASFAFQVNLPRLPASGFKESEAKKASDFGGKKSWYVSGIRRSDLLENLSSSTSFYELFDQGRGFVV
jgi:hypothetical protein